MTSSARASSAGGIVRPRPIGRFAVDDQLERSRLQHRQIGRFGAGKNPTDIAAHVSVHASDAGAVAH